MLSPRRSKSFDLGDDVMFGFRLRRLVPPLLRSRFRYTIALGRTLVASVDSFKLARRRKGVARKTFRGERIAVLGFFQSRIGIGRAAHLLARELEGAGLAVQRIDVTKYFSLNVNVPDPGIGDLEALDDPMLTDIVLCMNPPEFYHLVSLAGRSRLIERCVIGYFHWELDRAPDWWRGAVEFADEIWVSSTFVHDALRATFPACRAHVSVRPYQIDRSFWRPAGDSERAEARQALGLATDAFVVFTSFATSSTFMRKNPLGAIASFKTAFPDPDGTEILLIRCIDAEGYPKGLQELVRAAEEDKRIRLLLGHSGEPSILTCYRAADAYLTLHRGEGYGLNIDEALSMGIPVVATSYSLNDAFLAHPLFHGVASHLVPIVDPQCVYDRIPRACWAEPDVAEAASALLKISSMKNARRA